jgi:NAD(P)-dependent dehydrogenase (short-subunit alcohol dehydrogenase family)
VTRVVRQMPATTPADVGARLHDAFVTTQAAVADGEPVVLCVDGPALWGQGSPEDSAVACGMLGLARALAFEGGSKGWRVNVVAVDPGTEPDDALIALAATVPGLAGQLLNVSSAGVGKVVP